VVRTLIVAPTQLNRALQVNDLIDRLLAQSPNQIIDVLCQHELLPLFKATPKVNAIHTIAAADSLSIWRDRIELYKTIKSLNFDQIIWLDHAPLQAYTALFLGVKSRLGVLPFKPRIGASWPYSRTVQLQKAMAFSQLGHWLQLCKIAPIESPVQSSSQAKLVLPANPSPAYVRRKYGVSALMPVIVIAFANTPAPLDTDPALAQWPARFYAQLALEMNERLHPVQIVFVGSTPQRLRATEIIAMTGLPAHNLCGLASLGDTMNLIASSRAVITDSDQWLQLSQAVGRTCLATDGSNPEQIMRQLEQALIRASSQGIV
jgi:ADP-heptose:LPS heptosyltransferase